MYETKIIVPSRKGRGLGNIAVEQPKDSTRDKVVPTLINGAIVVAILCFFYMAVEPFLGGTNLESFQATASDLAYSVKLYVAENQTQPSVDLAELGGIPTDPWGNNLIYDSFFERIVSTGPDGKLHSFVEGVTIEKGEADDDLAFYCNSHGRLWYSKKTAVGDRIGYMNADGSNNGLISVATESVREVRYPVLSPDGKNLAFAVLSAGKEWQLAVSEPDGSDVRFLPTIGSTRWPCWDRSGTSIIYESKRADDNGVLSFALYRYDFGSSSESRILSGRGSFRRPVSHWDFDDTIAYVYIKLGRKLPRIALFSNDDQGSRDYISTTPQPQKSPSWFADGIELAYIARVGSNLQAFSMTKASREAKLIKGVSGKPKILCCAPFGRRVAVVSQNGSIYELVIIDLATGRKSTVHRSPDKFLSLSWSL